MLCTSPRDRRHKLQAKVNDDSGPDRNPVPDVSLLLDQCCDLLRRWKTGFLWRLPITGRAQRSYEFICRSAKIAWWNQRRRRRSFCGASSRCLPPNRLLARHQLWLCGLAASTLGVFTTAGRPTHPWISLMWVATYHWLPNASRTPPLRSP